MCTGVSWLWILCLVSSLPAAVQFALFSELTRKHPLRGVPLADEASDVVMAHVIYNQWVIRFVQQNMKYLTPPPRPPISATVEVTCSHPTQILNIVRQSWCVYVCCVVLWIYCNVFAVVHCTLLPILYNGWRYSFTLSLSLSLTHTHTHTLSLSFSLASQARKDSVTAEVKWFYRVSELPEAVYRLLMEDRKNCKQFPDILSSSMETLELCRKKSAKIYSLK